MRVKPEQPKRLALTVVVRQSDETIDFDAWVRGYVRAVMAADAEAEAVATSPRASVG